MLLNSVVAATGYEPVYGRSGLQPRKPNEVGVHAIRGGTIVGEHDVMYCGEDEIITLKHSAHSKKVFAKGAIKASKWLIDKPNGLYDMEDVLFN
jgi:4-hydroxy-tetrahydrodipicolinate reductase